MDGIFRAVNAQSGLYGEAPVVGHLAKEAPEGNLLEKWAEKLPIMRFMVAKIKVKLKAENVDICYPPIFKLESKAYGVLLKAQEAVINGLKPGRTAAGAYQAAVSIVEKEAPELAANLTRTAGTGIGLEFREFGLQRPKRFQ
ncbi:hypothetical protein ACET3Z_005194 [Daucus carota]